MKVLVTLLFAICSFGQTVGFPGPGARHDTGGGGAITLISHTAVGGAGTSVTTAAINTAAANFLVVFCTLQSGETMTVTSSPSNTWNSLTAKNNGNTVTQIWYAENASVSSSQTFTCTSLGGPDYPSMEAAAFSNVATMSSFDVENGTNVSASSQTTIQPGSVTPGSANELVIAALGYATGPSTVSVNSSFSIIDTVDYLTTSNFGSSMAYLVQTTATAENPTWTLGSAQLYMSAVIATFK